MLIDHRVADSIKLALSWRRGAVGVFLTLLERGGFGRFLVLLAGDEDIDAIGIEGEGLVVRRRHILVRQNGAGAIGNERHGLGHKLFA